MRDRKLVLALIIVAALSQAVAYVLAGFSLGLPPLILILIAWIGGELRQWRWAGSVGLMLFLVATAVSLLLGAPPITGIITVIAALVAWDIGHLDRTLNSVKRIENEALLERQYRQRIILVALSGLLIAGLAATIRINFGFGVALLLGLIAIAGFSRTISFLRHESD